MAVTIQSARSLAHLRVNVLVDAVQNGRFDAVGRNWPARRDQALLVDSFDILVVNISNPHRIKEGNEGRLLTLRLAELLLENYSVFSYGGFDPRFGFECELFSELVL